MPLKLTKAQFDTWVRVVNIKKSPCSDKRKHAVYFVAYCYIYDDTGSTASRNRIHGFNMLENIIKKHERSSKGKGSHDSMGKHYYKVAFRCSDRNKAESEALFKKAVPRLLVESQTEKEGQEKEMDTYFESTYLLAMCFKE